MVQEVSEESKWRRERGGKEKEWVNEGENEGGERKENERLDKIVKKNIYIAQDADLSDGDGQKIYIYLYQTYTVSPSIAVQ